jgi:hypothetical protein
MQVKFLKYQPSRRVCPDARPQLDHLLKNPCSRCEVNMFDKSHLDFCSVHCTIPMQLANRRAIGQALCGEKTNTFAAALAIAIRVIFKATGCSDLEAFLSHMTAADSNATLLVVRANIMDFA